jgi:hypothetical protein
MAETVSLMASYDGDLTSKFHGVLTEELSPLQTTLLETNKNMTGLSTRFVEMESLLTNLCKTVDVLQSRISTPEARPKTNANADSTLRNVDDQRRSSLTNMSTHEQALVDQLVARIEHLSVDVANYDATRQLKEDNLLLRKDLQVNKLLTS